MGRFALFALLVAAVPFAWWWREHLREKEEGRRSAPASRARERPASPSLARPAKTIGTHAPAEVAATDAVPAKAAEEATWRVELLEPPAERWAEPRRDDAATAYAGVLRELAARGAEYDPVLGRAAREVAYQHSFYEGTLPRRVLQFILRSAGAVDRGVIEGFTATTAKGDEALRARARQLVTEAKANHRGGPLRVGVGEAFVPGAKLPRFIAVLISRREVEIDRAPVRARAGSTWTLTGRLPPDHRSPHALLLDERGKLEPIAVRETSGGEFRVEVPCPRAGVLELSVAADGPFGPTPLVQLPIYVDRAPPKFLDVPRPKDEGELRDEGDAEGLALALLNEARARHGLPSLRRDGALDGIARAHGVDMRAGRFFGHRSPTTGDVGDRLAAARYRAVAFAENLARAQSIAEASEGLYESLGHRRNLLGERWTHVGVAVVAANRPIVGTAERAQRDWFLVQIFAKPALAVVPEREADRVFAQLSPRRLLAGASPLERDARLDRIATEAASTRGEDARRILADANRRAREPGGSWAFLVTTTDIDGLSLPKEAADPRWVRAGVGVHQAADDPRGRVRIVVLLGARP